MRRDKPGASRRAALAVAAGVSALAGLATAAMCAPQSDAQAAAPAAEARRIAVGEVAPDFTLRDPDGTAFHLAAMRGKQPVVLVFFRGVW